MHICHIGRIAGTANIAIYGPIPGLYIAQIHALRLRICTGPGQGCSGPYPGYSPNTGIGLYTDIPIHSLYMANTSEAHRIYRYIPGTAHIQDIAQIRVYPCMGLYGHIPVYPCIYPILAHIGPDRAKIGLFAYIPRPWDRAQIGLK